MLYFILHKKFPDEFKYLPSFHITYSRIQIENKTSGKNFIGFYVFLKQMKTKSGSFHQLNEHYPNFSSLSDCENHAIFINELKKLRHIQNNKFTD